MPGSPQAKKPIEELENWNLDRTVDPFVMVRGMMGKTSSGDWVNLAVSANGILQGNTPLDIARGLVGGQSVVQLVGNNPDVGTVFEDMWDAGVLSTLDYDAQTGNFTPALVLTGGTSGATAVIVIDDDDGTTGTLTIRKISGTFQNNETITDSGSGSATSNGTVSNLLSLTYPTAGETWEIISESANDTSAGTGARTVEVVFIEEATRAEVTKTFTLNGQTAVSFSAQSTDAYRFRSASVKTWGSATSGIYGKSNLGTIVIRDSSTKNVRGLIICDDSVTGDTHGLNNSLDAHYTVPAGKTAFPVLVTTNVTKNHDVTIRALVRADGVDGFTTLAPMRNYQNSFILPLDLAPAGLPEKTDAKFIARSNNSAVAVVVELLIILIDN